MKLSILLNRRAALQRQVRLADLAYAYQKLSEFSARITRAQLRGKINLKQAAPDDGRCWASLTALAGNQSGRTPGPFEVNTKPAFGVESA